MSRNVVSPGIAVVGEVLQGIANEAQLRSTRLCERLAVGVDVSSSKDTPHDERACIGSLKSAMNLAHRYALESLRPTVRTERRHRIFRSQQFESIFIFSI